MPDGKSGSRYRSKLAEGLRALRLVRRRPTVNNIGPRTTARRERLGAGSRDPSSALQPPAALCSSPHARCCAHLVAARSAWLARLPDRPAARVCAQAAAPEKSYELEVRAECDDAGERAASRPSARPRRLARPPASQCSVLTAGALLAGRDRVAGRERARREPAAAQCSVAAPRRTPCSSRRPAAAMRATCTRSCAPVCVRGMCAQHAAQLPRTRTRDRGRRRTSHDLPLQQAPHLT